MDHGETKPAPPETGRSHVLDGLRGYAAAAVVFYHTILAPLHERTPEVLFRGVQTQATAYDVVLKTVLSVLNGEVAVYVFFVISGIVLHRALQSMHERDRSVLGTSWRFLLRRFLRIWPVMAACLIVKFLLFHQINMLRPSTVAASSAEELIINLWLIRFPVHGATWTLFVELAGAPILLLGFFLVLGLGRWILVPLLVYSLVAILKHHSLMFSSRELMAGVPFLLTGVAVSCGLLRPLILSRLGGLVQAAAFVALLLNVLFVSAYDDFRLHYVGLLVSVTLMVAGIYHAQSDRVSRFLDARFSRYLGRLSFSLYLWNVPIFELLFLAIAPEVSRAHPIETGLLVGFVAVLLTLPVAEASEWWLEQPCIRLGRALTRVRNRSDPVPRSVQPHPDANFGGPDPRIAGPGRLGSA